MSRTTVSSIFNDQAGDLRSKLIGTYGLLLLGNVTAWATALITFGDSPLLLGTAFLAYSIGLRHAFDADHLAAIDNVTRKLMQEGKRPVTTGFFFSLGHSTVVVALTFLIALTAAAVPEWYISLRDFGSVIGAGVSTLFLFAIAAANIFVLIQVYKAFQSFKRGGHVVREDLDQILSQGGPLVRIFRRLFRLIDRSWQMYPLGLLFGLGFDTATEVSLLGISASQAAQGLSIWSVLVFPALFTSGMSLMDTTDGLLMLGVYGHAFVKPVRKLCYNLTITFVSVLVALGVGMIDALGLIGDKLGWQGRFWDAVSALTGNFTILGYAIVALFMASWIAAFFIYRAKGRGELGAQSDSDAAPLMEVR